MAVLGFLLALAPLATDFYLPGLPDLSLELGASMATAQATVTVTLFGMGLGQLVFGPVSDAVGRRRPAVIATLVHGMLSIACALVSNIWVLLVLRLLQGLCGAAVLVVVMAMVRDLATGRAAGKLISRLMLVMGVAPVLGPTAGGVVLLVTNWRGLFVALAVLGLLIGIVSHQSLPESLGPDRRGRLHVSGVFASYRTVFSDPLAVSVLIVSSLASTATFAFISASPFVYQEAYAVGQLPYALLFGANAVCMIIGTQVNALLLRAVSPPQILMGAVTWMTLCAGATVVMVSISDRTWAFAVPMGMFQLGLGLVNPSTQIIGLHHHAAHAGAAAAVLGAGRFMVAGILSPLVGLFGRGAAPLAVVMAGCSALGLIAVLAVRVRARAEDFS